MAKSILITCTDSMMKQFLEPHVKNLAGNGYEVEIACSEVLNRMAEVREDLGEYARIHLLHLKRSPLAVSNIRGYREIKQIIRNGHYDLIWTNEPVMGVATRLAARKARKQGTKVMYMVHGFHFYKGAPLLNWLIFYPIEKHLANKYTDLIITIAQEDYELTKRKFKPAVEHIYGVGVDPKRYKPATPEEQQLMRSKEGLSPKDFVVSCTKELMFDNNQKTIISAVNMVRDRIPNIKLLLAGNGPDEEKLKKQIESLQLNEAVTMLGYRTDLEKVIPAVDVVVSCSYREGMPLNIIEAMLCERPIIASHNRGHDELIDDGKTGFLINALDANLLAEKLLYLYNNPDEAIRFGKRAYQKAQKYTVDSVTSQMLPIIEKVKK